MQEQQREEVTFGMALVGMLIVGLILAGLIFIGST